VSFGCNSRGIWFLCYFHHSIYLERLLLPFQRSLTGSLSQTLLYQKDIVPSIDGQMERTSIAYASVNRFFCAFIDHVS